MVKAKSGSSNASSLMNVVGLLAHVRRLRKIPQHEVAYLMGLAPGRNSSISTLERSDNPNFLNVVSYAQALGLKMTISVHFDDFTVTQKLGD